MFGSYSSSCLQNPLFVLPPHLGRNIPNILECPLKASDFMFPGLALHLLHFLLMFSDSDFYSFSSSDYYYVSSSVSSTVSSSFLQFPSHGLRPKLSMSILVWFMAGIYMCGNCTVFAVSKNHVEFDSEKKVMKYKVLCALCTSKIWGEVLQ